MRSAMDRYALGALADGIAATAHARVGLQFPDGLLPEALDVEAQLHALLRQRNRNAELFILADAAASPCCVDEIAAAHADITLVVQFGHSCMTPPSSVAVIRRFGARAFDVADVARALGEVRGRLGSVVVFLAQSAIHASDELADALRALLGNERVAMARNGDDGAVDDDELAPHYASAYDGGQTFAADHSRPSRRSERGGYAWSLPSAPGPVSYVWVGSEDDPHYVQLRLLYHLVPWHRVDLDDEPPLRVHSDDVGTAPRALRRRRFVMQRALEADIVGIVACVLGARGCRAEVERLRRRIANTGRKTYVLSVGRPTPAKLANYAEVGAFVLVACPQTALLDDREYLRPVLTPYEAEIAFGDDEDGAACWDGVTYGFVSSAAVAEQKDGGGSAADADEGRGLVVASASSLPAPCARAPNVLSAPSKVGSPAAGTAAEYLASVRTWTGMGSAMAANADDDNGAAPVRPPRLGRAGRAAGYGHERASSTRPPTDAERQRHVARFLARARELAFFARPSPRPDAASPLALAAPSPSSSSSSSPVAADALAASVLSLERAAFVQFTDVASYVHSVSSGVLVLVRRLRAPS